MLDRILGSGSVRSVTIGGVTALMVYVAGAGLTACSQFLIARLVGAETFGVYSYVLAWVTVLAYFSALGFDIALLRFVSAYRVSRSWGLLRGVIRYAERRTMIVGALTVLVGATAITLSTDRITTELRDTFLAGFVLVPIWALIWIRSSIVRAFGGVISAVAPDRVVRDSALICILLFLAWQLKWELDASLIMMATVASAAIALLLTSIAVRRIPLPKMDDVVPTYDVALWRKTILPLMAIAAAESAFNRSGVLVLGWIESNRDAGIYALIFSISFLVALPRTAANTLLAPTIADLFIRRQHHSLQVLTARIAVWTLCGATASALALTVIAEPFLTWFGHGYEAGIPALHILLVGQVIAASFGSQLSIMTMTGCERMAALLLIVSALFSLLLSALLVHPLGLAGAAISTTISLIVWNVAMAVAIWYRMRLMPSPIFVLQSIFRTNPAVHSSDKNVPLHRTR
jgi:O-antigen/teichoic acid export membrane protein